MIKKCAEANVEKIKEIYCEASLSAYTNLVDEILLNGYLLKYKKEEKKFGNEEIYAFFESEEIAGFIEIVSNSDNIEIAKIYVSPKYQNLGIGKKLIDFVENQATSYFIKKINLWVLEKNKKGRKFYLRNGYKETNNIRFLERYQEYQLEYMKELRLTTAST